MEIMEEKRRRTEEEEKKCLQWVYKNICKYYQYYVMGILFAPLIPKT